MFGEVIDLRCGDRDPIARDGHVILAGGAAPELMNLISTSSDVTFTFSNPRVSVTHFLPAAAEIPLR